MKRSKKYIEAKKSIVSSKTYPLEEASQLIKKVSYSKFDGTINISVKLSLKDKQKKDSIRGTVVLPNLLGEAPKVAVICDVSDQEKAKKAGADYVGLDDLIKKIEEGLMDFKVLIATPDVMSKVARLGKVIGKTGLMPNPKNGTVTKDVEKAIESFKSGKTNFKMVEGGLFQFKVAKVGMTEAQIVANVTAFMKSLENEIKKYGENMIKYVGISPSMGPAIYIDPSSIK